MNKHRKKRRASTNSTAANAATAAKSTSPDWPRTLAVGALFALVTATPLLPSEAAERGVSVPLSLGWLVLALTWWAVLAFQPTRKLLFGGAVCSLLLFACWTLISAVAMAPEGNTRFTINLACQWISYAALFFVSRQLLRTDAEQRAMVVLLVFLAVTLSFHAAYQYFVSLPAAAAEFLNASELEQRDVLLRQNLNPDPDSPDRRHFVDRLRAREPFATFGLSNSFAAMLAPILALVLAVAQLAWDREKRHVPTLVGLSAVALLISMALLLTKSRTSFLAAALGLALLAVLAVAQKRVSWKVPAAGGALLLVLLTIAVLSGEIDAQILSGMSKSLRFRLEYWQSTFALIADYPLFGCGVGNFQAYYAGYKLPQASETIADPHNFVLEVCANAGTPALLAIAALAVVVLRVVMRRAAAAPDDEDAGDRETVGGAGVARSAESAPLLSLSVGALVGLLLAFTIGGLVDFIPDVWLFLFALFAAAVTSLLASWVRDGQLSTSALAVALFVLLLNLTVAGGFSFPGVCQIGWLLLAMIMNRLSQRELAPNRAICLTAFLGLVVLTFLGLRLAYAPLNARHVMASPLIRHSAAAAELELKTASEVDVFWDEPWEQLASLYLGMYRDSGSESDFRRFETCVGEVLKRNQRSHTARRQIGDWYLTAYRLRGRREHLQRAVAAYEQAVARYPNSHGLRAQLAWAQHVAGRRELAIEQADASLRINDLHPHMEQKLKQLRIYDPGPAPGATQTPGPGGLDAEQWMIRLRKMKDIDTFGGNAS